MRWKPSKPRFRLSTMALLVALCAAATWAWMAFLSPTRRLARLVGPDQPAHLRREAAVGLGYVPSWEAESAIDVLIGTLGDPSPRVRENATSALGAHGVRASRAVPAVLRQAGDPDRHVRYSTYAVLGLIAPPDGPGPEREAVAAVLRTGLDDPDPMNRLVAAVSLFRIGETQSAIPPLASAACDPDDDYLANQARNSIRILKATNALTPALAALVADGRPARRRAALDVLIEIARPEAVVAALRAALDSDDAEVRRWAGERLEELAPPS